MAKPKRLVQPVEDLVSGAFRLEAAGKRLKRALLSFRLEGVTCNIPLLRDILDSKEYADATYHTGSMTEWLARRSKVQSQPAGNGSISHNGKNGWDQDLAAAIGVAMALAVNGTAAMGRPDLNHNPWLYHGRRQQVLSRSLGSRGWR